MQSVVVIGRKWFERTNGNTYHSVEIHVDGEFSHKIPFQYGYGDQWEWTAAQWLEENGHMPGRNHYSNGGSEALRLYCERTGIACIRSVTDVQRKKDL